MPDRPTEQRRDHVAHHRNQDAGTSTAAIQRPSRVRRCVPDRVRRPRYTAITPSRPNRQIAARPVSSPTSRNCRARHHSPLTWRPHPCRYVADDRAPRRQRRTGSVLQISDPPCNYPVQRLRRSPRLHRGPKGAATRRVGAGARRSRAGRMSASGAGHELGPERPAGPRRSRPPSRRASPRCGAPAPRAGGRGRAAGSSASTRSTPARLSPSSVVISWMRRSRSTSSCEYRRVPLGDRCGSISPRASYMRSVCGCISASSAATEIMKTPRSEVTVIGSSCAGVPSRLLARTASRGLPFITSDSLSTASDCSALSSPARR